MSEQRTTRRIGCDIILNKIEDGHTNVCRAEDISFGGMKLRRVAEGYQPDGEDVQLQFALPGQEEPIWVCGQKAYEEDGSIGVRFTYISYGDFVQLRDWLQDRCGEEITF